MFLRQTAQKLQKWEGRIPKPLPLCSALQRPGLYQQEASNSPFGTVQVMQANIGPRTLWSIQGRPRVWSDELHLGIWRMMMHARWTMGSCTRIFLFWIGSWVPRMPPYGCSRFSRTRVFRGVSRRRDFSCLREQHRGALRRLCCHRLLQLVNLPLQAFD